ncbi:pyrroline-5-carboxylate reductase [Jiulongibacter sp. NS-SX5]|uniref:pyrroline-5-carboxylate reductase n=1 Tax=Jiulongibacter sp. NS-SX5 TaxID=3463854 RepID=UPI0040586130
MKLLVIGAGNMGLTYAKAIANSNIMGEKVMIMDMDEAKMQKLAEEGVFDTYTDLSQCVSAADAIMVAVKPQHKDGLFEQIKPMVKAEQLIISVMAGVTIESIQNALGLNKVVRAMPNLPSQVNKGMTTFYAPENIAAAEVELVDQMLGSTGKSLRISKEDDINTSTAVSGSGPAYIFYFIQAMLDGAKHYGYDDETAKTLVTQTFAGALEQYSQGELTPTEWMNMVASKGGTTREALNTFDAEKVNEGIVKGMIACYDRAIELSKM